MALRRWLMALAAPLLGGSAVAQQADGPADDPLVVTGVTSALGGGGFKIDDRDNPDAWTYSVHLIVWRQGKGSPQRILLRLEKALPSQAALSRWMEKVPSGKTVSVRLAAPPKRDGSRYLAQIADYLGQTGDAELAAIAEPMLRPAPFVHPRLGRFTPWERIPTIFEGKSSWRGQPVKLILESEGEGTLDDRAANMLTLLAESERWHAAVEARIIAELYDTWVENWRKEGEPLLSRPEWLSRMRLESITLSEQGGITFDFDDGDLFWGHTIQASGSQSEGITDASIYG